MSDTVYLVRAYHGPDFPVEAGWTTLGVFSTPTKAADYGQTLMDAQHPDDPLAFTELRITEWHVDELSIHAPQPTGQANS